MQGVEIDVLSQDVNARVIRTPGRLFPAGEVVGARAALGGEAWRTPQIPAIGDRPASLLDSTG